MILFRLGKRLHHIANICTVYPILFDPPMHIIVYLLSYRENKIFKFKTKVYAMRSFSCLLSNEVFLQKSAERYGKLRQWDTNVMHSDHFLVNLKICNLNFKINSSTGKMMTNPK